MTNVNVVIDTNGLEIINDHKIITMTDNNIFVMVSNLTINS